MISATAVDQSPGWKIGGAFRTRTWCAAFLIILLPGCVARNAPMQPEQRPFGIPTYAPVKASGSDFKAWMFSHFTLPSFIATADKEYTHNAIVEHFDRLKLDPAKLKLMESSPVRVYFIGEGSGYTNALGVNLKGLGIDEGDPRILFPNVNATVQLDNAARQMRHFWKRWFRGGMKKRSPEMPLIPGDFADLGVVPAGTPLNFFLIANDGQNLNTYSVSPERNPDKLAHMVAMAIEGTPFLLMSFEDMFQGGDADYEDCVFAVQMSVDNVASLVGRLDPMRRAKQMAKWAVALTVILGGPLGFWIGRRRLRRRRVIQARELAEESLRNARPREALTALRRVKKFTAGAEERLELAQLEVIALESTQEVAELAALYDESAEAFQGREPASLLVGRTQIETERFENFDRLRAEWRGQEGHPAEWVALEADALMKQEKEQAAFTLLTAQTFDDGKDALRLARLACLRAAEAPAEADAYLRQAMALAPHDPEVLRAQAWRLESQGKLQEAVAAYQAACTAAPGNPFLRDALAEFHRRQGQYPLAQREWAAALPSPTTDYIWSKALFWARVAAPLPVGTGTLAPPPGVLLPLIDLLRRLPPDRFWDPVRFEKIAHERAALHARQEVFWLQVLHALHTGNEMEALSLLNLSGFGQRSWHAPLEKALARILTCRRTEFPGPPALPAVAAAAERYPLFAALEQAAIYGGFMGLEQLQEEIRGPRIFAAAFTAAGWNEAAARLDGNAARPF